MKPAALSCTLALLAAALATGCADEAGNTVNPTPPSIVSPTAPDETSAISATPDPSASPAPEPTPTTDAPAPPPVEPPAESPGAPDLAAGSPPAEAAEGVALIPVKFVEYRKRLAEGGAKLTLVDAWASWCGPCKENFPHLLEMDEKYASKGLRVISLSLDDPEEPKQVADARQFLNEKKSKILNLLLDETPDDAFGQLEINAIPAVFLFGPDGQEIKRFTLDDPNNQFTYEEVEKHVAERLGGE